jgi:hypothetical protein
MEYRCRCLDNHPYTRKTAAQNRRSDTTSLCDRLQTMVTDTSMVSSKRRTPFWTTLQPVTTIAGSRISSPPQQSIVYILYTYFMFKINYFMPWDGSTSITIRCATSAASWAVLFPIGSRPDPCDTSALGFARWISAHSEECSIQSVKHPAYQPLFRLLQAL